jgi:ribosomal-protein-alanine N-acetyltransferase
MSTKHSREPTDRQSMSTIFDFSSFPTLETPNLTLRELVPADAKAILRVRGDIRVTRMNSGQPMETLDEAREWISKARKAFADHRRVEWGITLNADPKAGVVGRINYNYWLRQDRRASIGYDLGFSYWGRGIMTETVRAVVAFGFEQMNLNRIEADADAENYGSIRVLEKVGFRREGVQQEQYFEWDRFHDLALFALLRKDYLEEIDNQ